MGWSRCGIVGSDWLPALPHLASIPPLSQPSTVSYCKKTKYIIIFFPLAYCLDKYPSASIDKLKRDLTSKCGEERRKLKC